MDGLQALEASLRAAIARYPEFRGVVRDLGIWLGSIAGSADDACGAAGTGDPVAATKGVSEVSESAPGAPGRPAAEPARPTPLTKTSTLTLGGISVPVTAVIDPTAPKEFGRPRVIEPEPIVAGFANTPGSLAALGAPPVDLDRIIARCAIKADACRWVREKRALVSQGRSEEEILPLRRAIIERAKANPGCWTWMLDPNFSDRVPGDTELAMFADLYDNMRGAGVLVERVLGAAPAVQDVFLRDALLVLAEAQSSLRVAVEEVLLIERENDQVDCFAWLKFTTQTHRVFLDRFMRWDDPGNPAERSRVAANIARMTEAFERAASAGRERNKLFNKVRYEAKRAGSVEPDERGEYWDKLAQAVAGILSAGVPASDAELREALLPARPYRPEGLDPSSGLARAFAEMDRVISARGERDEDDDSPPAGGREATAEVVKAASLLEGKRAVIIGGIRNEQARESLERDLRLRELRWVTTNEHQSTAPFEPEVARSDLAIVLVRFSGHAFVEDVRGMCDRYGKPYVRVPGGYGTNQIAHHVLKQASRKLGGEAV